MPGGLLEAAPPDASARRVGADWPGFLGARGDARSDATGLVLSWPESGPPVRWHREIGEGYSMPAVQAGRLFVFDRHGGRARLSCLGAETGSEIWRREYPTDYEDMYGFSNGPRCSPVVDGERVYTFGVEGRLRCHRVDDGELLWEVDTAETYGVVQNFFGVGSTPVVEDELLIVQIGGSPPGSPGVRSGKVRGNGTAVVAFDKTSGEERYRIHDGLASYSSPVLATIGDRRWGFVFVREGLLGFDPRAGRVDFFFPWRARKLESVNAASPVVVGNRVLITESYGPGSALLEVAPGGYEVLWKDGPRDQRLASHWTTPVHHEGWVYGCHGSGTGDAEMRALELRSGRVGWRQPGLGRHTLLYVDGHLVVLSEDGVLRLVEATPEAYRERGSIRLEAGGRPLIRSPAWNAPILANGLLYLRGKDRLVCLDLIPPGKAARP